MAEGIPRCKGGSGERHVWETPRGGTVVAGGDRGPFGGSGGFVYNGPLATYGRTLAELRGDLMRRLGYGAQASNPPPGMADLLKRLNPHMELVGYYATAAERSGLKIFRRRS